MPQPPIIDNPITAHQPTDLRHASAALCEEIEAMVDYLERAEACDSIELTQILEHHAREEAEHAVYLIDWIRRNVAAFKSHFDRIIKSGESVESQLLGEMEFREPRELDLKPPAAPKLPATALDTVEVNHA